MSEFRKDIVSGDWIVMAPERNSRPHNFKDAAKKRVASPVRDCPFEQPQKTGNWPPVRRWPEKGEWQMMLIPNKYPALRHAQACSSEVADDMYRRREGCGWHDLLVTRDHEKDFPRLRPLLAEKLFNLFQDRYRDALRDKCLKYVSVFANWGPGAGASLFHPHYQLLALPIIPPHVNHALVGSERYFRKHGRCVHCDIIRLEKRRGAGVIFENKHAVALAPFASRQPYSVQIFPKQHASHFEDASPPVIKDVTTLLQKILLRMGARLGDPDYNFFIHSAPLRSARKSFHYHWHVEVVPKISHPAGFELSTGIDINVVLPEQTAKLLR